MIKIDCQKKVLLLNTTICLDKRIAFGLYRGHVVSCYE